MKATFASLPQTVKLDFANEEERRHFGRILNTIIETAKTDPDQVRIVQSHHAMEFACKKTGSMISAHVAK